ncbi:MAG: glycosyl transferase [Actinobacteria bacterium]|nr:glycosyl transferase [Actinomycetota bacterium]
MEPVAAGSTIVFFPEGAFGPTNNCVGIGDVLRQRGHRVVFIVEESFAGTLEEKGFEERLIRLTPPPEAEEVPGQFWKDFIRDTAPVFREPTIEQLGSFIAPTFQALIDGARYVDDRLHQIFDELRPDVVVEDNVVTFPALLTSGIPWVRIASCNPAEMKDHLIPPPFSGYATADSREWDTFWAAYSNTLQDIHDDFGEWCEERGTPALPRYDFIHESPWLNLYLYPEGVDYSRARPLGPHWQNLQASVRGTDSAWDVPEAMRDSDLPLIYLSMGSLGSADVELMRKLIAGLTDAPYRVIVSKGPQAKEIDLAANMAGAEFLPQTSILPKIDLVITHGGNNTVTESLYFGKPMIVLPIFWDQHDNAQRIAETGFGVRLDTYQHEPEELREAIDQLLGDRELGDRLTATSASLRAAAGTLKAADLLERVLRE